MAVSGSRSLRVALVLLLAGVSAGARVKTGLDVLMEQNFAPFQGKRVGIITNQTGRTEDGRRIIDVFAHAPNVRLTAIFSPEHGLEGVRQDRNIGDGVDVATGVPVYSLYNEGRYRPTPEMLKDVDVLVYDIHQNGARFLTRITTLGYTMEAAAAKGIPFYVLDRPNGINGVDFGGPRLDPKYVSFVGYLPGLPIRHGMTAGELAQMYNGEKKLGVDLHVIRMEGWKRSMWYDDTGLEWVNPSPNIRNVTQAILYPGMCLLESKEVSVGRGTDTPFQMFGAPWYRAREAAEYLNQHVPGVRFVHRTFTPNASVYKDQECQGVDVTLVNRDAFDPILLGLELLHITLKLHPGKFDLGGVMRLLGSDEAAARLKRGETGRQVLDSIRGEVAEFGRIRAKYLLYEADSRPATADKAAKPFAPAFRAIEKWIDSRAFPGAVLAVGQHGKVLVLKSFGRMTYDARAPAVPPDAIFDLASCSKVAGCTTAAAILYDRKQLDLDAPVVKYLPEFAGPAGHDEVLVRNLLTHSSGIDSPGGPLWKQASDRAGILKLLYALPLSWKPGERTQYRDYNMILMGEIVQRIAGQPLDRFLAANAFRPLGMKDTGYNPSPRLIKRIPPTEQDDVLRHRLVRGVVHDENAFLMGGVSGHAGLFSTARDLSTFAQMYLNGGIYKGKRIITADTIRLFMTRQSTPPGTSRALGWDTPAPGSFAGDLASPRAIMHTGFTGTSIYIDPDRDAFIVLLTNRVYPTRNNDGIFKARPEIHAAILTALDRMNP
jgi:uncharacterized protein YbbC (DUF1343 family)/CubicO group peptidase (beta-lactamase class C family)